MNINFAKTHWKDIAFIVLGILIIIGGVTLWSYENRPGKLDDFAKCVKESGTKFYGAFWCTHCQNQKKLFGNSERKLPYVECSTLDGNGQLQICKDEKIIAYPTWVFPDGSRLEGELSLEDIAGKTKCELPK